MSDWLTKFPLKVRPDSWDLNPLFLHKLQEMEDLWASKGYRLQWGCEVEFKVHDIIEADERGSKFKNRPMHLKAMGRHTRIMNHFREAALASDISNVYGDTLNHLRNYFRDAPDGHLLLQETNQSVDAVLAQIDGFERDLTSDDEKISSAAYKDIFLAHLHTRKFGQGGLRDLIEPRFGNATYGIGWNDVVGAEIRTRILGNSSEIIESYHKYLATLTEEAAKFGLLINLGGGHPQYHLSIVRESDNKNMMEMKDEESIAFCERILSGYHYALQTMPFMIEEPRVREYELPQQFSAGTSRLNFIRMLQDNWEFRFMPLAPVGHPARQLMMIMMGMAHTLDDDKYQKVQSSEETRLNSKRQQQPIVKHKSGNSLSGIKAALEQCVIGADGSLQPNLDVLINTVWRLKEEIGPDLAGAYVIKSEDQPDLEFNLSHPSVWMHMLSQLKVTEDNRLDTSSIDHVAKVAAIFSDVEVTGRRTVLACEPEDLKTQSYKRLFKLAKFMMRDIGNDFFNVDEQAKLIKFYSTKAHQQIRDMGQYLVESFASYLPTFRKGMSDTYNTASKVLAGVYHEHFFHDAPQYLDMPPPVLDKFIEQIRSKDSPGRDFYLSQMSYRPVIRDAFNRALDKKLTALLQRKNYSKKLAAGLNNFDAIVNTDKMMFNVAAGRSIGNFLRSIQDGTIFQEHGCIEEQLKKIVEEKSKEIYAHFAIDIHDPIHTNHDINLALSDLLRFVNDAIAKVEDEVNSRPGHEMAKYLLFIYSNKIYGAINDLGVWCLMNPGEPSKTAEKSLNGFQKDEVITLVI